ncbi:hypothetical protein M422DRAFT_43141 [Sphaerobolus stellatus SS14]|nr:hypothetical protein M422DRAFT_43141 [Sphaerobolus stellatus SS14]
MENWCVDEEHVDVSAKKRIASTQSHEVAHMWFGNITTASWWDNLWLNEGFATLMGEVIILNKVFPEWKYILHPAHRTCALSLDAKWSSHPIQATVPNAEDINQIFDSLSYSKAVSGTSFGPFCIPSISEYNILQSFICFLSMLVKKNSL